MSARFWCWTTVLALCNTPTARGQNGAIARQRRAATTVSHTYDIADRLQASGTDAGLVYDAFGRITTLPSADTGNAGGNTTVGYYTNDLVRTQTQGSTTLTWSLDASGRLASWTNSATSVNRTNHYDGSDDSPDWIAENAAATNWTRNVTDLSGNLAATLDQAGTLTWQVSNLHGDTVATAANTDLEPTAYYLTDEYGLVVSGYNAPDRYGWLGAKQRPHDDLGGLTLMGVRLYTPKLGRFLQVDPVPGGSASAYAYPSDPVNAYDLDGRCWNGFSAVCWRYSYYKAAWHRRGYNPNYQLYKASFNLAWAATSVVYPVKSAWRLRKLPISGIWRHRRGFASGAWGRCRKDIVNCGFVATGLRDTFNAWGDYHRAWGYYWEVKDRGHFEARESIAKRYGYL